MNENTITHLEQVSAHSKKQAEYITKLKAELEKACTSKDGVLIWKIKGVAEKMQEARGSDGLELVSLPFFTSDCGYKLQASLFLGGNGGGEDAHLSIYIKVLPGEYDSILKWPFRHTISFTLLDQNPDGMLNIRNYIKDDTMFIKIRADANKGVAV